MDVAPPMRANAAPTGSVPPGTPQPVTVAISRHIKPGKVAEYDAWLHEMTTHASRQPGYHGSTVLRPRHGGTRPEYTTILHFDTEANLTQWLDSAERKALLDRVVDIADEPADEVIFESGMDYWFTPDDVITPAGRPPPRWKMTIILTTLVFVFSQIYRRVVELVAPPDLGVLAQLVTVALVISTLTYFAMPRVTRRLAFWLQPKTAEPAVSRGPPATPLRP